MKIPVLDSLNQTIGLDLGTTRTRIWVAGQGVVLDEPTCLAVDSRSQKVLAVGEEAQAMTGRVSQPITLHYPIQKGHVYDMDAGRALLKVFLQKVLKSRAFFRPIIMASLPASATQAQRVAMVELLYSVGAREVYTIAQPLAAAIGAGVPIADASGSFIVQMGSGVVEAAVISLASLIRFEATHMAGDAADNAIKQAVRKKLNLHISLETARKVKQRVVAVGAEVQKEMLVTGQDAMESSPKEVNLETAMLQDVIHQFVSEYERMLKQLFVTMPPELTADVIDKGMLLSGGWAQLSGFETHLVSTLGIPVSVVDTPEQTVIKGIALALENLDLFKQSLAYQV